MSETKKIKPFKVSFTCQVDTIKSLKKLLTALDKIPTKHNLYDPKIGVTEGEIFWSAR